MQPNRRAAHVGIFAAIAVLIGSLSLIWARQDAAWPTAPTAVELEQFAPAFILTDTRGVSVESHDLLGDDVAVFCFTSSRCPDSNRYRSRILELASDFADDGVSFVAIHPTAASPTPMELDEIRVQDRVTGQDFPSLVDPRGAVAAAYGVAETPLFVVIDRDGRIRYRGTLDDHPDPTAVTQHYLADAIRDLLERAASPTTFTQAGGRPDTSG